MHRSHRHAPFAMRTLRARAQPADICQFNRDKIMQRRGALARPALESRSFGPRSARKRRGTTAQQYSPNCRVSTALGAGLPEQSGVRVPPHENTAEMRPPAKPSMSRSGMISAGLLGFRRREGLKCCSPIPAAHSGPKRTMGCGPFPRASPRRTPICCPRRGVSSPKKRICRRPATSSHWRRSSRKAARSFTPGHSRPISTLQHFASNTFEIEWPPKSGRRASFPEIDRIAYFALPAAARKILPYQLPLLRELKRASWS